MFCALLATTLIQTTVDLPRFPSLSPNGDRICFSSVSYTHLTLPTTD